MERVGATGVVDIEIENPVVVGIEARKHAVARRRQGGGIRRQRIVVLDVVGPLVEIVIVGHQLERTVEPPTEGRPDVRLLERGELGLVVVRNVEILDADTNSPEQVAARL